MGAYDMIDVKHESDDVSTTVECQRGTELQIRLRSRVEFS
jgi:hypothetical protein